MIDINGTYFVYASLVRVSEMSVHRSVCGQLWRRAGSSFACKNCRVHGSLMCMGLMKKKLFLLIANRYWQLLANKMTFHELGLYKICQLVYLKKQSHTGSYRCDNRVQVIQDS